MTQQNEFQNKLIQSGSLAKSSLVGAGIALLVISFFVLGVDEPHPEWGKFWIIKPLLITPLAGAMGGAIFAIINHQILRGFNKALAVLISTAVFLIVLWLGTVLGLAGTMWD